MILAPGRDPHPQLLIAETVSIFGEDLGRCLPRRLPLSSFLSPQSRAADAVPTVARRPSLGRLSLACTASIRALSGRIKRCRLRSSSSCG